MGTRGRTNEINRHLVLQRPYDVESYFVFPFNLFNMYDDGIKGFSGFSTFRRTAAAGRDTTLLAKQIFSHTGPRSTRGRHFVYPSPMVIAPSISRRLQYSY